MWSKCKDYEETFVLIKTNFNRTIGAYNSNKWEETKVWKPSKKSFQFYFGDDK